MEILLTGCSGFIGSHLCSLQHDITGYDLFPPKADIDFIEGDINDIPLLTEALEGKDAVIHLAALPEVAPSSEDPTLFFDANTRGTFNLLLASLNAGIKKFIFASSSAVYGRTSAPSKETDTLKPVSIYGADKMAGEAYCHAFRDLGLPTTILRPFNVYGKGNEKGVMYDFTLSLLNSPSLSILGDGSQAKDFTHISDVVSAFNLALTLPPSTYNIGSGEKTSIKKIASIIADELKIEPEITYTGQSWKGDIFQSQADISKLKAEGWAPKVPLEDGLRRYVKWLKSSM